MKPYITSLFIIAWILLSSPTFAHEKIGSYNLTEKQTTQVEKILEVFFQKVEGYDETKQTNIYSTLNQRIWAIIARYEIWSPQRAVLDILDLSVDHMSEKDENTSVSDVLRHVIYGTEYHILEEIKVIIPPVEDNNPEPSDEEVETEEVEDTRVYRADLDTKNLNEFDKDILAGTAAWVMSLRVRANLEPIETERVEITFNQDVDNIGLSGNLYHDGVLVGHASKSDVRDSVMIFDNMTDLTIEEQTTYLQLEIITETIWKEYIWQARDNIAITRVSLQENKWTITWDNLWNKTYRETSRSFSIVPVKITANAQSEFGKNSSISRVRIRADADNNNDNGSGFSGRLTGIKIEVSAFDRAWDVSVFNWNGVRIGWANISWSGEITIALDSDSISSRGESYEIITNAEAIFRIPHDGIIYSAGNQTFTSNLDAQVFLGNR